MTSTERLRALLDERGIEWKEGKPLSANAITRFCVNGVWLRYVDYGDYCWIDYHEDASLAPEQAIAATVGSRSCASCPEMDDPNSYISHIHAALEWHDEHVPRPTDPRNTCVVLEGKKPPEEVLFIGPDGVTHYLPEVSE